MRIADLKIDRLDAVMYASLRGEIDMSNAAELRQELTTATTNDALGLILDLGDVSYLDSAGIHLIHRLREDLRSRGQKLQLVIPTGSLINHTLRLAGMHWEQEIAESAEAARHALLPCDSTS